MLSVEVLEARAMLAGNITAATSAGNLIIHGDSADNGVLISQGGPGEFVVTGYALGGAGTSINGQSSAAVLTGITGDIRIDLGKGNDALAIGQSATDLAGFSDLIDLQLDPGTDSGSDPDVAVLAVPKNLSIVGGGGADTVVVIAAVGGSAKIDTGNQDDSVGFGNLTGRPQLAVGGNLSIVTGKGGSYVDVENVVAVGLLNMQGGEGSDVVAAVNSKFADAKIATGGGNDAVGLVDLDLNSELVVDTGAGNDDLTVAFFSAGQGKGPTSWTRGAGRLTIRTGDGADVVDITDFAVDQARVDTGSGDDGDIFFPVLIANATISGSLTVNTGAGNDFVAVLGASLGQLSVDTGAGNDGTPDQPVQISDVHVAGGMNVTTGQGNDVALLAFVSADHLAVDMGSGDNQLDVTDESSIANAMRIGMGGGNDRLRMDTFAGTFAQQTGSLSIDMGAGTDTVDFLSLIVVGKINITLGAGNDTLTADHLFPYGDAKIDAGAGNDSVSLTDTEAHHDVNILLGAGDDSFTAMFDLMVAHNLELHLGAGHDTVSASGLDIVNQLLIDGNGGDKAVTVVSSLIEGDLKVLLGPGSDTLSIIATAVYGTAKLRGGSGHDGLDLDGVNIGSLDQKEFEEVDIH
jgi:hypothetical protein